MSVRRARIAATFAALVAAATLHAQDTLVIHGRVIDQAGRPVESVALTLAPGLLRVTSLEAGRFEVRGLGTGVYTLTARRIGYQTASVRVLVRDVVTSVTITLIAVPHELDEDPDQQEVAAGGITTLNTVTIKERQQFDIIRADIDHRRNLGFGYRIDSVQLTRLPGVGEAFTLPSVHVQWHQGQWSLYMTGTGAYHTPKRGGAGLSMSCAPTVWIDGFLENDTIANSLTKDEVGLIEVYTSAASAPLEYTGTRSNCGVVLIWRKRFIGP